MQLSTKNVWVYQLYHASILISEKITCRNTTTFCSQRKGFISDMMLKARVYKQRQHKVILNST